MPTLNITGLVELLSQGVPKIIKAGTATAARLQSLGITVTGTAHHITGSLATGSAATIFDGSTDLPATFDHGFFWADQSGHLQLIDVNATGTNVILEYTATNLLMFEGTLLAAANETKITDASTTLRAIDQVVYGQGSGSTANYVCLLVD